MPRLQMPRAPYDLFVCSEPRVFFMHFRWLRATAFLFTFYTGIVRFLSRPFDDGPVQSCKETVRKSCGHLSPSKKSQGYRMTPVRCPYGRRTGAVRWLCHHRVAFGISVLNEYNFSFLIEMPAKQALLSLNGGISAIFLFSMSEDNCW